MLHEIPRVIPYLLLLVTWLDERRGGRLVRRSLGNQISSVRTAELQPFIVERAATPWTSFHRSAPKYNAKTDPRGGHVPAKCLVKKRRFYISRPRNRKSHRG